MSQNSFAALPQFIQALVNRGLDREIEALQEKIREEKRRKELDQEAVSAYEGDILQVERLRRSLTTGI